MMRMLSPSSRLLTVGHDEDAPGRRAAQSQESRFPVGVTQIRALKCIRISEYRGRLFERYAVLEAIDRGLPRVPLEHNSVYTKVGAEVARLG
jgi:hypothetical protein